MISEQWCEAGTDRGVFCAKSQSPQCLGAPEEVAIARPLFEQVEDGLSVTTAVGDGLDQGCDDRIVSVFGGEGSHCGNGLIAGVADLARGGQPEPVAARRARAVDAVAPVGR